MDQPGVRLTKAAAVVSAEPARASKPFAAKGVGAKPLRRPRETIGMAVAEICRKAGDQPR